MGLKRKYLNSEEQNNIMCLFAVMQQIEGLRSLSGKASGKPMWEDWEERGVMSKEAKKYLKTAHTYLDKFKNELLNNLDENTLKLLHKRLSKFDFKILDDYIVQKLNRDIADKFKYVVFEREIFDDFIPEIAQTNCIGCKKDYCSCDIYKIYQSAMLPTFGEESNCPYSADLSKYTPEEIKKLNEIKAKMKAKNKFIKG